MIDTTTGNDNLSEKKDNRSNRDSLKESDVIVNNLDSYEEINKKIWDNKKNEAESDFSLRNKKEKINSEDYTNKKQDTQDEGSNSSNRRYRSDLGSRNDWQKTDNQGNKRFEQRSGSGELDNRRSEGRSFFRENNNRGSYDRRSDNYPQRSRSRDDQNTQDGTSRDYSNRFNKEGRRNNYSRTEDAGNNRINMNFRKDETTVDVARGGLSRRNFERPNSFGGARGNRSNFEENGNNRTQFSNERRPFSESNDRRPQWNNRNDRYDNRYNNDNVKNDNNSQENTARSDVQNNERRSNYYNGPRSGNSEYRNGGMSNQSSSDNYRSRYNNDNNNLTQSDNKTNGDEQRPYNRVRRPDDRYRNDFAGRENRMRRNDGGYNTSSRYDRDFRPEPKSDNITVNVILIYSEWAKIFPHYNRILKGIAYFTLRKLDVTKRFSQPVLHIFLGGNKLMATINQVFNREETVDETNVLSFDYFKINYSGKVRNIQVYKEQIEIGEVILSIDAIVKEVQDFNNDAKSTEEKITLIRYVSRLLVHGILHIFGYDHATEEEEKIMFSLQDQIVDEYFSRYDVEGLDVDNNYSSLPSKLSSPKKETTVTEDVEILSENNDVQQNTNDSDEVFCAVTEESLIDNQHENYKMFVASKIDKIKQYAE